LKKSGIEVALTMLHAAASSTARLRGLRRSARCRRLGRQRAVYAGGVEVQKDGFVWRQSTPTPARPAGKGEATRKTGTSVSFWPDPTIFETPTSLRDDLPAAAGDSVPQPRSDDRLQRRAGQREAAAAERKEVTFCYKGGIADFVRHLNQTKTPIHARWSSSARERRHVVEIAMQWNESYGESVYTFANTINTHEGGTHEEGFRAA
jgi:DNA gyrase subunit B